MHGKTEKFNREKGMAVQRQYLKNHERTGNGQLHGPPKLVDKTNFGLVIYNHANFYRFEETSSYWSGKRTSVFSAFHWSTSDTPPASQCTTVVTNIENRA